MDAPAKSSPLVIAHRGASAERPEHTIEAYTLAIEQGADFIEPDLVPTRDGVLVARHENALSGSTDVAERPEFAGRRTRKRIDGVEVDDWFTEDFTLAEMRTLRARETRPRERPGSAGYDGRFGIPTFAEVLALARDESQRRGRPVGVYPETKHPTFFLHEGRHLDGSLIGLDTSAMLLDELVGSEFTDPAQVFIQSFEIENLLRLRRVLMPHSGLSLHLVLLLGDTSGGVDPAQSNFGQPYDLRWNAAQGRDLRALYGALADAVPNFGEATHYSQLLAPRALAALRSDIDGLGAWIPSLLQATGASPDAADPRPRIGAPAPWLAEVLGARFAVHAYTLRPEPAFLLLDVEGAPLNDAALLRRLVDAGVTGVFADAPGRAVAALKAMGLR